MVCVSHLSFGSRISRTVGVGTGGDGGTVDGGASVRPRRCAQCMHRPLMHVSVVCSAAHAHCTVPRSSTLRTMAAMHTVQLAG